MKIKTWIIIAWLALGACLVLSGRFPGILWFIVFAIIIWAIPSKFEKTSKESAPSDTSKKASIISYDGLCIPPKLPVVSSVISKSNSKSPQNNGIIDNP